MIIMITMRVLDYLGLTWSNESGKFDLSVSFFLLLYFSLCGGEWRNCSEDRLYGWMGCSKNGPDWKAWLCLVLVMCAIWEVPVVMFDILGGIGWGDWWMDGRDGGRGLYVLGTKCRDWRYGICKLVGRYSDSKSDEEFAHSPLGCGGTESTTSQWVFPGLEKLPCSMTSKSEMSNMSYQSVWVVAGED